MVLQLKVHSPFKRVARRGGLYLVNKRKGLARCFWAVIYPEAPGWYQRNVCAFKPLSTPLPRGKYVLSLGDVQALCPHRQRGNINQTPPPPGSDQVPREALGKAKEIPRGRECSQLWVGTGGGLHRGGGIWASIGGMSSCYWRGMGYEEGLWYERDLPLMGGSEFCDDFFNRTLTSIEKEEAFWLAIVCVNL